MYRYWTKEDESIMTSEYGKTPCVELAKRFNRSEKSVQKKAVRMGLKSKVSGSEMYLNPHNKGKEWNPKEKHHAWRKVGEVWEAAGNLWIKPNRNSKPIFYRRHLLEQLGYDLTGLFVIHVDGNNLNCELGNLKAITQGEHARRNYNRCKDTQMRSLRMRMGKTKESFVDLILKGEL